MRFLLIGTQGYCVNHIWRYVKILCHIVKIVKILPKIKGKSVILNKKLCSNIRLFIQRILVHKDTQSNARGPGEVKGWWRYGFLFNHLGFLWTPTKPTCRSAAPPCQSATIHRLQKSIFKAKVSQCEGSLLDQRRSHQKTDHLQRLGLKEQTGRTWDKDSAKTNRSSWKKDTYMNIKSYKHQHLAWGDCRVEVGWWRERRHHEYMSRATVTSTHMNVMSAGGQAADERASDCEASSGD